MKDIDQIDQEYGQERDPCPFCGGMTDGRGHLVLTRVDGAPIRCQAGDVRVLAKRLRLALTIGKNGWSTAHSLAVAYSAAASEKAAVEALQRLENLGDASVPAVLPTKAPAAASAPKPSK